MTLDLAALAAAIDGFAKTRFIAVPVCGGGYDAIDAVDDGEVMTLAEVYADDCAAPIVEILNGAAELLRLARAGAAYIAICRHGLTRAEHLAHRLVLDAALALDRAAAKEPT